MHFRYQRVPTIAYSRRIYNIVFNNNIWVEIISYNIVTAAKGGCVVATRFFVSETTDAAGGKWRP